MKKFSQHAEWLSLVEISGPFLAVSVLDRVFPQGLDAVYPNSKHRIRSAYEEWSDAVDSGDPSLSELHREWVRLVLADFLEIPNEVLHKGANVSVVADDGSGTFAPDWILCGSDGKPLLYVAIFPPGSILNSVERQNNWMASPLDKMTKLCRIHNVRLGLLTNGEQWMLVNAPSGMTSGNVSWYARLWFQEPKTLQAFSSLLGVRRFFGPTSDTLPALLDESLNCMEEVTDTLGEQVRTAVEVLIQGLDKADDDRNRILLRDVAPSELYEAGLTVMMRLVFLLCAEERGLLLLGSEAYDRHYAVSTLRGQLAKEADKHGVEILERRHDAWARLLAVFRAVYAGIEHPEMRLPALGGSLFNPDKYPFLEGRPKGTSWKLCNPTPLPIDNRTVLLLLSALQVLEQSGGAILLSYRALDVEQIGHIYEGLLEHTAIRTTGITLGLSGSAKSKNPNIALAELESLALESEERLFDRLRDVTGRSPAAIRNAYQKTPDPDLLVKITAVCAGSTELMARIAPYANFLRRDAWEQPLVYQKNAFMVTMGLDRRESGTHYTPKVLTEKIVKTTLEPITYIGPAEGKPRSEWILKSPTELLNLKICDPAMGSGAFLVQSCRYLAERLFEAWEIAEKEGHFIDTNGIVCNMFCGENLSKTVDDRMNIARQLIAERCLYGVDINPMAVELAKLSIWLVTISKGRPFGFLDHNLKSGDSLLGIHDLNQLRELRMKPEEKGYGLLFGENIRNAADEVIQLREQIRNTVIRDITDVEHMVEINVDAQHRLEGVKLFADLFIGEAFSFSGNANNLQTRLDILSTEVDNTLNGDEVYRQQIRIDAQKKLDTDLPQGKPPRKTFHWALEFPEVFQFGGFDAICGNPPFSGGQHLTGSLGTAYRNYLVTHLAHGTKGSADLVSYFYLRAYSLLKNGGIFGLIACNTIAEGDTRRVGLERLLQQGATIIAANPNMPWPGAATVVIALVFIAKKVAWHGKYYLNDGEVATISAFLSSQKELSPKALKANTGQSFMGSIVLGMGFTMSEAAAQAFIAKDPKNAEVLFPYLNGDDLNSNPTQKPSRWVINFFDWPLERDAEGSWALSDERKRKAFLSSGHVPADYTNRVAADFPELLEIIRKKAKPERDKSNRDSHWKHWWQYGEKRPALYHAIGRGASFARHPKEWNRIPFKKILVITLHTKYFQPRHVNNDCIVSHALTIFTRADFASYCILISSIMQEWVWKLGSRLGTATVRFTPSDCYETFPFPTEISQTMAQMGELYERIGCEIMLQDQIGLTNLYNAFHNPENKDGRLEKLRQLQKQIDEAVRDSYNWNDIALEHGFHVINYLPNNDNIRYTISETARIEILHRLFQLNHQRWREEQLANK